MKEVLAWHVRFSILMPVFGFFLSCCVLYPARKTIAFEVISSVFPTANSTQLSPPPKLDMNLVLEAAERYKNLGDEEDRRVGKLTALNLPAIASDLPVAMFSADHQSWHPRGIDSKTWHCISYPFVGIVFWWLLGRGFDQIRNRKTFPPTIRTSWLEVAISTVVTVGTLVLCIGFAFTTTAEDRESTAIQWFVGGAVLWFILECFATGGWIFYFMRRRRYRRQQSILSTVP